MNYLPSVRRNDHAPASSCPSSASSSLVPAVLLPLLGAGGGDGLTPDRIYKIYCELGQGRLRENIASLIGC